MIITVVAIFLLLLLLIYLSYKAGSSKSNKKEKNRRPVKTLLYYKSSIPIKNELSSGLRVTAQRNINLPSSFDCREKWQNLISTPLDQGTCGSCWAFASATAIADRFRIANPTDQDLLKKINYTPYTEPSSSYVITNTFSPYELVSCDFCKIDMPDEDEDDEECDMGCEGGYITHVYKYIMENGITTLECSPPDCDPMNPQKEKCDCTRQSNCKIYKPRSVYSLFDVNDSKEERIRKIKEEIYTYGPVTNGFTVNNSFYTFFDSTPTGIYSTASQPPGDTAIGGHAVVVIGWGRENNVEYWLCRNSWGINWGIAGYFKIQIDWGDFLEPIWMCARI